MHWLFPCIPIMQEDIKVYEDKLATLESISLLSRKEHMLPRGDDYYMYIAKECLSGLAEELK